MSPTHRPIVFFVLGVVAAVASVRLYGQLEQPATAQTGGISSQAFAVSTPVTGKGGLGGSTEDTVFIIDPSTKQIASYTCDGRTIKFIGARRITYDLKLKTARDSSHKSMTVSVLEREWKRMNEKAGGK